MHISTNPHALLGLKGIENASRRESPSNCRINKRKQQKIIHGKPKINMKTQSKYDEEDASVLTKSIFENKFLPKSG